MEIYLVGGAIRNEQLGLEVNERDWVVVGATPEELLALGYQPVGKDFPVFLHPETHEEYALARTERKTGKGYKGFAFHASPEVSLTDDLLRRDLTVNAIAQTAAGELIDPYHGMQDLQQKLLRHVSPAFAEDPVRILRTARFAAKLDRFTVHPDTNQLMKTMVTNGEVDALVAERVWKELSRALTEPQPLRFFEVLADCDALAALFPEITDKALTHLQQITEQNTTAPLRFAALLQSLSKSAVKTFCQRYRVPNEFSDLAMLASNDIDILSCLDLSDPEAILICLKRTDGLRRPERLQNLLAIYHTSHTNNDSIEKILQSSLQAVKKVSTQSLQQQNLQGQAFALALQKLQIAAIKDANSL